jgi:hypothetical protein
MATIHWISYVRDLAPAVFYSVTGNREPGGCPRCSKTAQIGIVNNLEWPALPLSASQEMSGQPFY